MQTDIIQKLRGLIAKATPGPWAAGVRSNQRAIAGSAGEWLALLPNGHREGFGLTSDAEVLANAALIVAAINHLPALLDRLEAAERGWQPIETAPRDETLILAYGNQSDDGGMTQVVFYCPSEGRDLRSLDGRIYPAAEWCWAVVDGATFHKDRFTHWRPLPDAPAIDAALVGEG